MGPVAPFIPLIASGVGLFAGRNVGGPSGFEKGLQRSAAGGSRGLVSTGTSMTAEGRPMLRQAGDYYSTILSGSRGAQNQLLQPEIGQITDLYRGAERSLERSGVRGPARDVASAEMARDRAGRISGLVPGLRPGAAGALAGLGQFNVGQGTATTATGVGGINQLLGGARQDRALQHQIGSEFGSGLGALTADVMKGIGTKKGGASMPGQSISLAGFGPR
jgi:hypothetical protein